MEYEERSGKLILATKAGEYASQWSAIVGDALSAFADRVTPLVAAAKTEAEIHRILDGRNERAAPQDGESHLGRGLLMETPFSMYQVGAEALLPPRDISVSQWADENVVLTGSGSAERGQWHTRPFQREPMDVLSPSHPCKQVVLMSAAQMLKTSIMVNFLGYIADVDPGPTLAVEPRSEDAKALSKDRVAPLFRHSPALRGKLAAVKSRDSNNTAMHKVFANGSGHITFTGAISPSGLAMRPIRYLLLDEMDRYPTSAGSEGDPVSLAMQRTGEFEHNKKVIMCSTPTVDGESRIQAAWNASDQREYFVPCPMCNHFQILVFSDGTDGGLVWPEGEPEKAAYCCEECRELIPHNQKSWMVERGEYRPQNPGSPIPGFRVSQLISPKRSWGTIAAEFLVANESRETLKAFLNTVLAELWTERGSAPDWEKVYLRREDYELGIVPAKGSLLVAGVDVQDDRLEVEIKAYGRGKESWSVDYRVIQVPDQAGQPLKTSSPEVWQELEALLAVDWPREAGGTMPIMAMTIDSGFRPQMVYEFAARHPQPAHGPAGDAIAAPRTVVATKGKPDFLKLIASVSPTDASRKRQNVRIWHIGTHWAKQEFYDWLRIVLPDDGTFPPGYQHYAYKDQDFYRGLCSESRIIRSSGKVEWVPDKSVRNEPLDLAVLCRAAAAVCGIDRSPKRIGRRSRGTTPDTARQSARQDDYWGERDELGIASAVARTGSNDSTDGTCKPMRDTLQRAIFSGTRRVQFTDRAVEYNSIDDMRKALADIDAAIAKASGAGAVVFQPGHAQQGLNERSRQSDRLLLARAGISSRAVPRGDRDVRIRRREVGAPHGRVDGGRRRREHRGRRLPDQPAQPVARSAAQQPVRQQGHRRTGREHGRNRDRSPGEDRDARTRQDHRRRVALLRGELRSGRAVGLLRHAGAHRADDRRER